MRTSTANRLRWAIAASLLIHAGAYCAAVEAHWQFPVPKPEKPQPIATLTIVTLRPPPTPRPRATPTPPPRVVVPHVAMRTVPVRVHAYYAMSHATSSEPQVRAVALSPTPPVPDDVPVLAVPGPAVTPVPATPVPVAAAPAPTADPNALAAWASGVSAKLERAKRYPEAARMRNQQGVVYLRVTVEAAGSVAAFRLERSSGIEALDREALALIARVQPLPALPANAKSPLEIVVPIVFSLQS